MSPLIGEAVPQEEHPEAHGDRRRPPGCGAGRAPADFAHRAAGSAGGVLLRFARELTMDTWSSE